MRISEMLTLSAVDANLRASNKAGVLRELVGMILKQQPDLDPNELVETLMRREMLQSTGFGDGVAIPHGKTPAVDGILACFGRSVLGVDFQSLDGQPSHLFFTIIVNESQHGLHLKALARISRLFKDPEVRAQLMEAEDEQAIYNVILAADAKL